MTVPNLPVEFTLLRALTLPDQLCHGCVVRIHSAVGVTELRYDSGGVLLSLVAVDGESRTILWEKAE